MTIKQKQALLLYLGYYNGNIDGIWGSKSEDATRRFQSDYDLDPDGDFGPATEARIKEVIATDEAPAAAENVWDGIKYFKRDEFRCRCGKYCDGFPVEMDGLLLKVADRVREHFGKPMTVSSGVRCQQHNDSLPGSVPNSRHLQGKAMDFRVSGFPAATVLAYVQKQPEIRYAYAIDSSYVHMDVL